MVQDQAATLVMELLDYVEQVEKLKSKPLFAVPEEFYKGMQHDLKGLVEVEYNIQNDGEDIWLRVPRLLEEAPPVAKQPLAPWVVSSRSPNVRPVLKTEHRTPEEKDSWRAESPQILAGFDDYVQNEWEPWAVKEALRRKTIAQYNKLFALQQAMATDGAETPLDLVWGIGFSVWNHAESSTPVRFPMLTQSCEIALVPETFALEVRPRDVPPRLELDCYIELGVAGVQQLESFWRSAQENGGNANRINPFEPSTYDSILKAAVTYLDAAGAYVELVDDTTPPKPEERLLVSNTWVMFAKKRTGAILLEDVRRLKSSIQDAHAVLPKVVAEMVSPGDDTVRRQPEQTFRGLSSGSGDAGALELYFPLPYNDEQVSVIQKLEHNDGVVVQGPPGTGKSHTIANIVCHFLAQGKRVLVTSKGETALAVLREKLPERVQPLSVALLSDERDGMRQFEHSIHTISSTVSDLRPAQVEEHIIGLSGALDRLHGQIHMVDQQITRYAAQHLEPVRFQGKEVMPNDLARQIVEQADAHGWFEDGLQSPPGTPAPLSDADMRELRAARIEAAEHLRHLHDNLPANDSLPTWDTLREVRRALLRAKSIDTQVQIGDVIPLKDHALQTIEALRGFQLWLDVRQAAVEQLHKSPQAWLPHLEARMRQTPKDDPLVEALLKDAGTLAELERQRKALVTQAIEVPDEVHDNADLRQALDRLVTGKSAFFLPFGKTEERKAIDACKVQGAVPATPQGWSLVKEVLDWRAAARQALTRWGAVGAEFGITPAAGGNVEQQLRLSASDAQQMQAVFKLVHKTDPGWTKHLQGTFEEHAGTLGVLNAEHRALVESSVAAHLEHQRLDAATTQVKDLQTRLQAHSGLLVDGFQEFLSPTSAGSVSETRQCGNTQQGTAR